MRVEPINFQTETKPAVRKKAVFGPQPADNFSELSLMEKTLPLPFQAALEIAKQQGARSWGLHAAHALAKLRQSTGHAAEAHAALAPALEGFAPTPEMPEIAEAQALLVAIEAGAHVRHQ